MLDLVVNNDKTAYSYTVNSDWVNFFTGEGAGAAYVNIDAQGLCDLEGRKKHRR